MGSNKFDLTVIYYSCNYLEKENPVFVKNTKRQLLKAIGDYPLISISHKPMNFGKNVCVNFKERSHLNIYRQIMIGCQHAKTKYVALAEDDIFYSYEHFHYKVPKSDDVFLYDMNKLSLFTWTKPPQFSFRHNREVVNQLIAPREMLLEAMQERFAKWPDDSKTPIRFWGDPGRYEKYLGVTVRETTNFMCTNPSIVFTHPKAYGYEFNHGKKKRLGDLRITEVPYWGRAEDMLKHYYEDSKDLPEFTWKR